MEYFIKTSAIDADCLRLPLEEYRAMRDLINQQLLTIYERIDYKDADWRHYNLIIVGTIGYHQCTHCFHAEEWYGNYRKGTLAMEMKKRLDWGTEQIQRIGELKTTIPRMMVKHAITATTVLRVVAQD